MRKFEKSIMPICIFFLCISLIGCSKISRLTGKENGGKGKYVDVENTFKIGKKKVNHLGEKIKIAQPTARDDKNIGYESVVQKAIIVNTPAEEGITTDKLLAASYYKTQEEPISIEVEKSAESNMVLCDLDITNINVDEHNISTFSLVSEDEKKEMQLVGYPTFFSNAQSSDSSKYYHFTLLRGQTLSVRIGWYIDLDDYERENLYLAANFGGDEDYVSYIKLEL